MSATTSESSPSRFVRCGPCGTAIAENVTPGVALDVVCAHCGRRYNFYAQETSIDFRDHSNAHRLTQQRGPNGVAMLRHTTATPLPLADTMMESGGLWLAGAAAGLSVFAIPDWSSHWAITNALLATVCAFVGWLFGCASAVVWVCGIRAFRLAYARWVLPRWLGRRGQAAEVPSDAAIHQGLLDIKLRLLEQCLESDQIVGAMKRAIQACQDSLAKLRESTARNSHDVGERYSRLLAKYAHAVAGHVELQSKRAHLLDAVQIELSLLANTDPMDGATLRASGVAMYDRIRDETRQLEARQHTLASS